MELVRKINSTYNQVNSNLLILKSEGITTEARHKRLRIIRLNKKNAKTIILLQALKILASSGEKPQFAKFKTDSMNDLLEPLKGPSRSQF